ncbi:MAG: rhomboid family intramembrane serine protease [Acidimicrobiales bacterium]
MFPISDENPTKRPAILTIALIIACAGVFFLVQPQDTIDGDIRFTFEYAAIPCEVVNARPLIEAETNATVEGIDDTACQGDVAEAEPEYFPSKNVFLAMVTSMFLHGSLLHLGGNMLFLWVFGNNVEDHLGRLWYPVFYLAAGVVATVAHIAVQLDSTVPVIGASGAIAGVMGAYLVWFPKARVRTVVVLVPIRLPAFVPLGVWFVSQFFISSSDGIAWMAHVGGFVFGVVVALLVRGIKGVREKLWDDEYNVAETPGGWDNRYGGIGERPW